MASSEPAAIRLREIISTSKFPEPKETTGIFRPHWPKPYPTLGEIKRKMPSPVMFRVDENGMTPITLAWRWKAKNWRPLLWFRIYQVEWEMARFAKWTIPSWTHVLPETRASLAGPSWQLALQYREAILFKSEFTEEVMENIDFRPFEKLPRWWLPYTTSSSEGGNEMAIDRQRSCPHMAAALAKELRKGLRLRLSPKRRSTSQSKNALQESERPERSWQTTRFSAPPKRRPERSSGCIRSRPETWP